MDLDQQFNDKLFRALNQPSPRPGIPCDHPGCASHLSHPCEGCGRYAAGLQNGPDADHARLHIRELARNDPVMQSFFMLGDRHDWTWEQTLSAMVIKQNELSKKFAKNLHDAACGCTNFQE